MASVHFVHTHTKKSDPICGLCSGTVMFYTENRTYVVVQGLEEISRLHFFDHLKILVLLLYSSAPIYIL